MADPRTGSEEGRRTQEGCARQAGSSDQRLKRWSTRARSCAPVTTRPPRRSPSRSTARSSARSATSPSSRSRSSCLAPPCRSRPSGPIPRAGDCSTHILVAIPTGTGGSAEVTPRFGDCNMSTRDLRQKRGNWEFWAYFAYKVDSARVSVAVPRDGKLVVTEQPAKPCLFAPSSGGGDSCSEEYIATGLGSPERGVPIGEETLGRQAHRELSEPGQERRQHRAGRAPLQDVPERQGARRRDGRHHRIIDAVQRVAASRQRGLRLPHGAAHAGIGRRARDGAGSRCRLPQQDPDP